MVSHKIKMTIMEFKDLSLQQKLQMVRIQLFLLESLEEPPKPKTDYSKYYEDYSKLVGQKYTRRDNIKD